MKALKSYLEIYHLDLCVLHKKGLTIVGEDLHKYLLVTRILYTLFDLHENGQSLQRISNTPIERQCYSYFRQLEPYIPKALQQIDAFLDNYDLLMTSFSTKFFLVFICLMERHPIHLNHTIKKQLPLVPMHIYFSSQQEENEVYNVIINLLDFSKPLDFPYDEKLFALTTAFVGKVSESLTQTLYEKQQLLDDCYRSFYKQIMQNHLHVNLLDRLVRNTKEHFPILYEIAQKYSQLIESTYNLSFQNEEYTTLTFYIQKAILRNRIINRKDTSNKKRVVIVSNSTYTRIDYFMAQLKEVVDVDLISIIPLNERHKLQNLTFDYVVCLSERIHLILKNEKYPVILLKYFLDDNDFEKLFLYGFSRIETKFLTESFAEEIAGLSKEEILTHLKDHYPDYFI